MTPGDGFPSGMYRFGLDADAEEELMTSAVDVADASPQYRAVAHTLQALREAPDSWEFADEPEAVERISAAVMLERRARPTRPTRRRSARVGVLAATALVVCALPLAGGLASAGALPAPAQDAASTLLGKVGISVPTSAEAPPDTAPPASAVPASPSTTPPSPSPGVVGSSPGASGPVPDAGKPALGATSPPAPDHGWSHQHDAEGGGPPPDNKDHGANKDGGGPHAGHGGQDGGNGGDHGR
jgi:hypothetical protein